MKAETFFKTIAWLQGACAIQHAPMQGMIDILYNELKDKYTDEQITTAAREIATKEELYGNYPSLRVWLKYCPQTQAKQIVNDKLKTDFLDHVSAVMYLDHLLYDHSETEKRIKRTFGWHGYNAFKRTGISLQALRNYHHAQESQKKQVLDKFAKAWDETDGKDPRTVAAPALPKVVAVPLPYTETIANKPVSPLEETLATLEIPY